MNAGDIGEVALLMPQLTTEEGFKGFLYDDATDLPVKAPKGNATIGFGCNVQAGWSRGFSMKVLQLEVEEEQIQLLALPWYVALNAPRRMVMLDIAFNDGFEGLMHFPSMIACLTAGDWAGAQVQCMVTNPELHSRYVALGQILLTGEIAG